MSIKMNKQVQQIKEMLCDSIGGKCYGYCENCNCEKQAIALYNAGYRKRIGILNLFMLLVGAKSELTDKAVEDGICDFSGQGKSRK